MLAPRDVWLELLVLLTLLGAWLGVFHPLMLAW
jgi:hypothetical protein